MIEAAEEQEDAWECLYERICELLRTFGTEDIDEAADYWVVDDNIGTTQQKLYVRNLALLRPHMVKSLQGLLADFPGWEIVVAVSVPGPGKKWPDMGLMIRQNEIIDGLQRQYFPEEFRSFAYEGSRPGTDRD